ncbi:MAG: hypothetical protein ACOH2M_00160 [Cypionkella sp.]
MALPLIAPICALFALAYWLGMSGPIHPGGRLEIGNGSAALMIILPIMAACGTLVVAVRWHRFRLLGEMPRWGLAITQWDKGLGYFGRLVLLAICSLLITAVLMIPGYFLIDKSATGFRLPIGNLPQPFTLKNLVLGSAIVSITTAFFLKWAIILPAGTIGKNLSLGIALRASGRYHFTTFLTLGLFLHLAPMLLDAILSELPLNNISGLLLAPLLQALWFMFGIGLLTTLYSHIREAGTV